MIPRIPVKKVMSQNITTIEESKDLQSVVSVMAAQDIGSLLVTSDGEVLGIITETDIVRRILPEGKSLSAVRVGDVMSCPVQSIDENDSLLRAHELMGEHHIRHLMVTREGKPVGMLSVRNLLESVYEWAVKLKS